MGQLIDQAKDEVSHYLSSLTLPMDPEVLTTSSENASKVAKRRFSDTLHDFSALGNQSRYAQAAQMPVLGKEPVTHLATDLRALQGARELDNEREISQFFKTAVAAADE